MRSKEDAHDYRYFPDPDLLPLALDDAWIEELRAGLPELPDARRARFVAEFGLAPYDAGVLTAEKEAAEALRIRQEEEKQQLLLQRREGQVLLAVLVVLV